jgi:uncharacterized protein with ParB-like and HNH nuclease domain
MITDYTDVHNDLDVLSITELFNSAQQYIIPIYQRNYAWGATEVEQLIQDIYDAAQRNEASKEPIHYFIGSLIVHLRDNGSFETIDGQQRHTTLSILLALLKNEYQLITAIRDETQETALAINLHFDSRPKSALTLNDLYKGETSVEPEEPAILSAYKVATKYLANKNIDVSLFSKYLLKQVKILRVKVPKGTNLNHYFEIMNNRGEQLEKHEVLKARLMGMYKQEQVLEQACFSAIWDACADMHRYVQLGFDANLRSAIFNKNWSSCPTDFNAVKAHFNLSENQQGDKSQTKSIALSEIIKRRQYSTIDIDYEETEKDERFHSVIDFPNFLLQVLRVSSNNDEVALDDKRLLDTFADKKKKLNIDPSVFIMHLLKYRMLFDKYIIKRDGGDKWSLLSLEPYEKSFNYNNSTGKEEKGDINHQLTMILSMLHVSYPAQVYKHWLTGALKALEYLEPDDQLNVAADKYLEALEQLSDDFFFGITGIKKDSSIEEFMYKVKDLDEKENEEIPNQILHTGTSVQNFVFNYLDYLLWQKIRSSDFLDNTDNNLNVNYIKKRYSEFKFSFRTSVEHYFPQTNPLSEATMEGVDRFGNLCLITPSSNSKLSNYPPELKKDYYEEKGDNDKVRNESLKQAFMMSYDQWSPDGQGLKNIEAHEQMMIRVLAKQVL